VWPCREVPCSCGAGAEHCDRAIPGIGHVGHFGDWVYGNPCRLAAHGMVALTLFLLPLMTDTVLSPELVT
jgi:hypothetical protein